MGLLQLQSSRAESPDRPGAAKGGVRLLPYGQRQEGRGLDAVLSPPGQVTAFMRIDSVAVIVMAAVAVVGAAGADGPSAPDAVDASGNLRVPEGYRTAYEFLGSWAVASDQGRASKELNVGYASPEPIHAT